MNNTYLADRIDQLIDHIIALLNSYFELFKWEAKKSLADALAIVVLLVLLIVTFSFALLFISIAAALFFSYIFNISYFWGFGIVSVCYGGVFAYMLFHLDDLRVSIKNEVVDKMQTEDYEEVDENHGEA